MSEPIRSFHQLCRLAASRGEGGITDAELLERFTQQNDPAAFEVLVWRHGPMVLGVCRRMLPLHDAEDAFQATFLTLVRKAGSVAKKQSVAAWLHTVAYRIALRARSQRNKLPRQEVDPLETPSADDVGEHHEWKELLDAELHRLPTKYRVPLVLSYLEGLTNQAIADQLGCPIGTVFTRLARGRDKLRERLVRQGITLSGGLSVLLGEEALAFALPTTLVQATSQSAVLYASGVVSASLSPKVVPLTEGVLNMMTLTKLKLAALVLALALVGSGTALVAWQRSEPGVAVGAPGPNSEEPKKSRAVPREALRYGGKSFEEWRRTLRTELKSELRVEAIKALSAFGMHGYAKETTRTILDVMRGFDAADVPVAQAGIKGINRMPREQTVPLLNEELAEGNPQSRKFVLESLRFMNRDVEKSVPAVVKLLEEKDGTLQQLALSVLATIDRGGMSVPALVKLAKSKAPLALRIQAIATMSNFPQHGKPAIPALVQLAKDPNPNMRNQALQALQWVRADSKDVVVPLLAKALTESEHPEIQVTAASYIRELGPRAKDTTSALIKVLKETKNRQVQYWVVLAMASIGPPAKEAVPLLLKLQRQGGIASSPGPMGAFGGSPAAFPGGEGGDFGSEGYEGQGGYPGSPGPGFSGDPIQEALRRINP